MYSVACSTSSCALSVADPAVGIRRRFSTQPSMTTETSRLRSSERGGGPGWAGCRGGTGRCAPAIPDAAARKTATSKPRNVAGMAVSGRRALAAANITVLVTATADLTQLLHDVLTSRVYDVARETPLDPAPRLSLRLGNEVLLKREDLQPIFSFKLRGAYNKIAHLTERERARGVIAASAGNHAQGAAFSARELKLRAVIVMPPTTPQITVDAVRAMGAEVVLAGDSYADAKAHCDTLAIENGMTVIHPFDDPLVIAGQGTIGAEILRHSQDRLSAVFVPVGGGGLIAGIAGYIKALRPDVKMIGVEPFEADAMYRSCAVGRRVQLEHVGLFADGVAVREVGERTFAIVQQTVDEIVRVTNDEICAAIKDVFDDTRSVMEPAGALAAAGLKVWVERQGARNQ